MQRDGAELTKQCGYSLRWHMLAVLACECMLFLREGYRLINVDITDQCVHIRVWRLHASTFFLMMRNFCYYSINACME